MERPSRPKHYSEADWNRRVWAAWKDHQEECKFFKGQDTSARSLCSDLDTNTGTVAQELDCLRCNIFCCDAKKVKAVYIKAAMVEKETPLPLQENPEFVNPNEPAKVIDITSFVSPDAAQYAKENARV